MHELTFRHYPTQPFFFPVPILKLVKLSQYIHIQITSKVQILELTISLTKIGLLFIHYDILINFFKNLLLISINLNLTHSSPIYCALEV